MTTAIRFFSERRRGLSQGSALSAIALALFLVVAANAADAPSRPQAGNPDEGKRPNIVIILADDQGWGDLSANGNTNLATPNIDSLAKSGATLDRFFVCPLCSPTRGGYLTGRYHPRGGVFSTGSGGERLNLDERTIADIFKAAGYATGAFGKWHNGTQYPYHPNARGFDEYYGFCSGHWATYFDPPLEHNGQSVRGHGFITDDLTDHAIAFIKQHKDRPFFCYLPFNTPHTPLQVPDKYYDKFKNAELKQRVDHPKPENVPFTRAVLAMTENIDFNVGRVLHALDELKLADNTIVIYFSDNGPNGVRFNGGMKGIKGSLDEGGVRAPFFIRWPGHIAGGKSIPQIAGAIDLLPTLTDLAGVPHGEGKPLDGVSLKPLLTGTVDNWPDRMIFSHWDGRVSVRNQRYRLDNQRALFDMQADPGQQHDISAIKPEVTARLSKAVARWRKELLPGLRRNSRPFTVGYPDFPLTRLPARDGVAHGGIVRSAVAPNSSYYLHWTSPQDGITWDIQVETPGLYEAVVYYACPASDVGSTVELSRGESRLSAKLTEANDPPLIGPQQDRLPRRESYTKDFKPLKLGEIKLDKGRGPLTLRALSVPGKQVMEFRELTLTLKSPAASPRAESKSSQRLPNIVIIYIDDLGYGDIGPFGAKGYSTPNLDRMAKEGTKFTSFYSAQAVCSASRAALMTGCYPNRVGISGALGPQSRVGLSSNEMTIAQLCKQKDYATAIFGKWHLGHLPRFLPTHRGFDEYFGLPYSNDMRPRPLISQEKVLNPDVGPAEMSQLTTWYTERAVSFIERNKDRPFFLYVPHTMVHVPLHVSDKFRGKTKRGLFGDVVEEVDWSVGQILDAIKKNGLDDNTLVMFCSDNGPWLGYGDHAGNAGVLREGKGTSWDGGVREPTLMRWPGHIPAGQVCDAPLMTIDMLPTIARLIGGRLPEHKIDGLDISDVITGKKTVSPHEVLYFYFGQNNLESLRSGKWKLELPRPYRSLNGRPGGQGGRPAKYVQLRVQRAELYDLEADPGETKDIADANPEVLKKLQSYAEQARADLGDGLTGRQGTGRREPGRVPLPGKAK